MLPIATTTAQFAAVRADEALLRPGVDAIVARHALGQTIARFADGSLPVYAIGDAHVLKLYPPVYLEEHDREASVLASIAGRLPIPTPRVIATGMHDDWGYVVMDRLRGESLATAWPRLDETTRLAVLAQLGDAIAALHEIHAPALGPPDWRAFVDAQRASAVERQRAKGLDDHWLAQIPAFLAGISFETPQRVLLHTEIMREHLRVEDGRLSGLFDFEPAMCGAPEYELAAVGVFVSCGEPRYLRAILRGRDLDPRRGLGYALLHRYSNLRWYLDRLGPVETPTLDALAERGWGTT